MEHNVAKSLLGKLTSSPGPKKKRKVSVPVSVLNLNFNFDNKNNKSLSSDLYISQSRWTTPIWDQH